MKSASKIGSSTSFNAAWTTRSAMVGMPKLRSFPEPRPFGINRWRTGNGRNEPSLTCARRSSRNPATPTVSSTAATVQPSTPGVSRAGVARDPGERHAQRRRVMHEVEQVIEPAARIGHRPTVKLGLHPSIPRPEVRVPARATPYSPVDLSASQRPSSSRFRCRPSPCGRLSRPRSTTAAPPRPGPIGRRWTHPADPCRQPGSAGEDRDGSHVHCCSLDG